MFKLCLVELKYLHPIGRDCCQRTRQKPTNKQWKNVLVLKQWILSLILVLFIDTFTKPDRSTRGSKQKVVIIHQLRSHEEPGGIRTHDLKIVSHPLCHLSYHGLQKVVKKMDSTRSTNIKKYIGLPNFKIGKNKHFELQTKNFRITKYH